MIRSSQVSGRKILITGAAGFIGSNFVARETSAEDKVVVLDALTYAGHRENLSAVESRIKFLKGDLRDQSFLHALFEQEKFDQVVNFAAESHVDRSITNPSSFVETNVIGVLNLLNASLKIWSQKDLQGRENFRFVQVSTDEVYGSLSESGYFTEQTPYAPNSPYSASKAGGDHLARAWYHTFGLPVIVTNCSNNYGPQQFPEKLIPHVINCAIEGKPLPVYGDGRNVRDWIHVFDHCRGISLALAQGIPGESYCFGGRAERRNIDVVKEICKILDAVKPIPGRSYNQQISFVEDRKGHDWRYAIDDSRAERELGFTRTFDSFEVGLKHTVDWYLANTDWIKTVLSKRD